MTKRLAPLAIVLLVTTVAACTETSLEPTPEAIPGCNALEPPEAASGEWGEAQGIPNRGVEVVTVNEGYTVYICAGGGNQRFDGEFSSPGMLEVGSNFNGWSVSRFTPPPTESTTTTTPDDTSTTSESTTTTGGSTTVTQGEITTTVAGATTTVAGATTTVAGATTTVAGATTTLEQGEATTTLAGDTTTSAEVGGSTLEPGQETTTTAEVGAGTLEPGQETSTTGEGGGTGDPGETTTTDGDDVEGGASESTLPYTGAGDMTTGGMAGLLVAAGIVLLLFARRKSGAE